MHYFGTLADPAARTWIPGLPFRLGSGSDAEDDPAEPPRFTRATPREDLPYTVELWDEEKKNVEQVLAVTTHGSIGYAAYYAATREYPDRHITLRHRNRMIASSNTDS
jgi:hypothetical protein